MKRWDVFISHASPDKESFVTPLAEALRERGVRVWLDRWAIELGDSISESISEGLTKSRFGIVVLSKAFFERAWPKKELGALFAKEGSGVGHIIPLWHRIEKAEVLEHAPLLADKMAARSDEGVASIVERIIKLLFLEGDNDAALTPDTLRSLTKRLFPALAVDEFWQTMLLADLDGELYHSVGDIELAYRRARPAVEAYARERPGMFKSGTDYLTKSLGFVDLCFRSRHNWSPETGQAFQRHARLVAWDVKAGESSLSAREGLTDGAEPSSEAETPSGGPGQVVVDRLFSKTYAELEELARKVLRLNDLNVPLSPGELVSETYLKLAEAEVLVPEDRDRFFLAAANAMRRLLLDYSKKAARRKSGGGVIVEGLAADLGTTTSEELFLLDEALNRLHALDPRKSRVVELQYFAGLTTDEVAEVMGVSVATVTRDWQMAKAWLAHELKRD